MSGPLVGLVMDHGPRDLNEWAIAVVLAEDMHHAGDTVLMSYEQLAYRARLGRTSTVGAVARLRAGGWVRDFPGGGKGAGGRGVANRYQLCLEEKFSTCSDTCRHAAGLMEQALGIPA